MAGLFDDIYNFVQAPANERKAREANQAFKSDVAKTSPTFNQVSSMGTRLDGAPAPFLSNIANLPAKIGTEQFGPPIGGNAATKFEDPAYVAATAKTGYVDPSFSPKPATPSTPWQALSWFDSLARRDPDTMANFPEDSDIPLNVSGPPKPPAQQAPGMTQGMAIDRRTGLPIPGMSMMSIPKFITGSSTGRQYDMDKIAQTSQYKYLPSQTLDGRSGFIRAGAPDGDTRSSAERYEASAQQSRKGTNENSNPDWWSRGSSSSGRGGTSLASMGSS